MVLPSPSGAASPAGERSGVAHAPMTLRWSLQQLVWARLLYPRRPSEADGSGANVRIAVSGPVTFKMKSQGPRRFRVGGIVKPFVPGAWL